LRQVLGGIAPPEDPRLLSGLERFEDAAVFRLDSERSLVATIDVITPIVDDPVVYGEIAAANALSDLYAMGAEGLFSLSFLGVPRDFPPELAAGIVRGGAALAGASGAPLVGGHSLESRDLLFGLAAIGSAHPEKLFRNDRLALGDELILTKPLGTGAIATALKNDALPAADARDAIEGMRRTNRAAVAPAREAGVRGATDVTGFGLLGHAAEMARASSVEIHIESDSVPVYPHARELLEKGSRTRGDRTNLDYARSLLPVEGEVDPLLVNPQTSGGLLIAVAAEKSRGLLEGLRAAGYGSAARIGRVVQGTGVRIEGGGGGS
jgi:selenide,water dikinase